MDTYFALSGPEARSATSPPTGLADKRGFFERGTHKTVTAGFWPWLSAKSLSSPSRYSLFQVRGLVRLLPLLLALQPP